MSDLILDILSPKTNLKLNVGLFFGSFNPVHIGHMAIANFMVEFTDIDQVWFVVTPQNPHKLNQSLLSEYDRLEMVNLAIGSDLRFRASDIEFRLPKPSFTVDTLATLSDKFPVYTFKLIMGSDNLKCITKWKNYEAILLNYGILVYPRPGFKTEEAIRHKNITIAGAPLMEISSSFIRRAIHDEKDVRHFLPGAVFDYIDKMNLYKK